MQHVAAAPGPCGMESGGGSEQAEQKCDVVQPRARSNHPSVTSFSLCDLHRTRSSLLHFFTSYLTMRLLHALSLFYYSHFQYLRQFLLNYLAFMCRQPSRVVVKRRVSSQDDFSGKSPPNHWSQQGLRSPPATPLRVSVVDQGLCALVAWQIPLWNRTNMLYVSLRTGESIIGPTTQQLFHFRRRCPSHLHLQHSCSSW